MPVFRTVFAIVCLFFLLQVSVDHACVTRLESLAYPDFAREGGIQGTVEVDIKISAPGKVVVASAASGHPVLRRACEQNVRKWEFSSSPEAERQMRITYEFVLEEPKTYYKPETRTAWNLPARVRVISTLPEPQPDR
jgi:TonB family protein